MTCFITPRIYLIIVRQKELVAKLFFTHSGRPESQVKSGQALTFRGNKKSAAQMGNASL